MRYIDEIVRLIQIQVETMEEYSLIKLENFQIPGIYFEICKKLEESLKTLDIDLIAKLSRERYLEWTKDSSYSTDIELLKEHEFIEETGSLTRWRNDNFLTINNRKTFVILMGTEMVVDKGGLADFYTISPETIEKSIGERYSEFFHGISSEIINNIYRNLFYYVEKDLYKLDKFARDNFDLDQEIQIKASILESLDETWNFPNMPEIGHKVISDTQKRIPLFGKAHKFSRRIGLDNLPTAKKIIELENKIDKYYVEKAFDIENDFGHLFPGYTDYTALRTDLIDYYCGINIDEIRMKLIKCDFVTLDKIIGLKIEKGTVTSNKEIKVYGNPISSIFIPFIKMLMDLDVEERSRLNSGEIVIEEIKLANVNKSEDDANNGITTKWNKIRRFVKGIDRLIADSIKNKIQDEFELKIISNTIDDEDFDPFVKNNSHELIASDVLKAAALRDSVSKITFTIDLMDKDNVGMRGDRYVWYIFDTDAWINSFDIIDNSPALTENKIDELAYYLPIGVCKGLDNIVEATNNDEFYEVYDRSETDYLNCEIDGTSMDLINTKSYSYGKQFIQLLRTIEKDGFLGSIKSDVLLHYYQSFKDLTDELLKNMKNTSLESKIYELSKAMTIISKAEDINKKGAQITMIPAYHPVMLEKVVQRYLYLCFGIDELLEIDIQAVKVTASYVEKKYSMLDQLATITSATAATINDMNRFEDIAKTYGYNTIFGKANTELNEININALYTKEDDELENVSGKLMATPVSNYISKTIRNYLSIYPYKQDGLRVMFFNPKNFSDIIAALKGIVDKYKKERMTLRIELIIYTSDYRCKVYNYLKSWIDNNITEDDSIDLIARIKYFDYKSGNSKKTAEESIQTGDITFMFEIMEEVELREEPVYVENSIETMFPSTYLPIPKKDPERRFLAISQLQFQCENKYTQLVATIKNPHIEKNSYQIFTESKLRNQFVDIIQVLHEKSNWVVVLDENVDPSLIKFTGHEIIGYSTGEGYFGELNATISSSETILRDIKRYLIRRMKKEFSSWENEEIKLAADRCIAYAYELDGAEVLKAINPRDEAIKDYLAFYLSTKIEQQSFEQKDYYYRKLLSLDLYDQLFDDEEAVGHLQRRPDFLLIEVPRSTNSIDDESDLQIKIRVIECKMGGNAYMSSAIEKAEEQVYAGNTTLGNIWENPQGVKRRYWQNQLYKILTLQNSIDMNSEELDRYAKKVMRIFNGNYKIGFENCIYTFSLENENNFVQDHIFRGIQIAQFNFGSITTKNVLLGQQRDNVYDFMYMKKNSSSSSHMNTAVVAFKKQVAVADKNVEDIEQQEIHEKSIVEVEINPLETTEKHANIESENNQKDNRMIHSTDVVNIFKAYNISYTDEEEVNLKQKLDRLDQELKQRKTKIYIQGYVFGPDIIRVELDLATGVNINQLKKYDNDMKYWLSINEKPFIYIKDGKIVMDIIRDNRQTVGLKNMLEDINKKQLIEDCEEKFYALLGADILGNPQLVDFSDSNTPHLLVAGQTGSGKSVLLNSMLLSVMMMYTPKEVEMILVDPKFIELTSFSDSPYTKDVITEAEQAVSALENLVEEMNNRYRTFLETKSKNISSYNSKVDDSKRMKRILMVIDEYAALMEENKEIAKRLESAIKILSQKARAAGIHLIICTQSPRADIITTTIRNNLTARVGLRVADSVASGLILDTSGAETLLGKGDMLLKTASSSEFLRAKSPYVTEGEIEEFIGKCQEVYE